MPRQASHKHILEVRHLLSFYGKVIVLDLFYLALARFSSLARKSRVSRSNQFHTSSLPRFLSDDDSRCRSNRDPGILGVRGRGGRFRGRLIPVGKRCTLDAWTPPALLNPHTLLLSPSQANTASRALRRSREQHWFHTDIVIEWDPARLSSPMLSRVISSDVARTPASISPPLLVPRPEFQAALGPHGCRAAETRHRISSESKNVIVPSNWPRAVREPPATTEVLRPYNQINRLALVLMRSISASALETAIGLASDVDHGVARERERAVYPRISVARLIKVRGGWLASLSRIGYSQECWCNERERSAREARPSFCLINDQGSDDGGS
ncbi:hypothetical protein BDN71DRAFT_1434331 [Pleurotus eryngii]|uniref:Uncharacterized protein n=1 Tax=Pleurotus eryngii TaxID=5323 RepID=A0A9P5ZMC5_PLEER|nr:hypothetical protein BDN71DRAFT_1434331 [Pleurotus eryngii]